MSKLLLSVGLISQLIFLTFVIPSETYAMEAEITEVVVKGSHGGRLLIDGAFTLELSIFETGVPPEFRVWLKNNNQTLNPNDVNVNVTLTRLGGIKDQIDFVAQDDFLRGQMEIYEPHSFMVTIIAEYMGQQHQWQYDNFEGRTTIEAKVAAAMSIDTEIAQRAELIINVETFGQIKPHPEASRNITARFEGEIKKDFVALGQNVKKGDRLMVIESNESLKTYTIISPISGTVTAKLAHAGEQSNGRVLLRLTDTSRLVAELAIFPLDLQQVKVGALINLKLSDSELPNIQAKISRLDSQVKGNQAMIAFVELNNIGGLRAGQFVTANIESGRYKVPLAVKRVGLQAFRDFTVVYAKVGNQYEVRMLELGRHAGEWVEVLGGLTPGTEYVTNNSFIIKADIEKSGASHDH